MSRCEIFSRDVLIIFFLNPHHCLSCLKANLFQETYGRRNRSAINKSTRSFSSTHPEHTSAPLTPSSSSKQAPYTRDKHKTELNFSCVHLMKKAQQNKAINDSQHQNRLLIHYQHNHKTTPADKNTSCKTISKCLKRSTNNARTTSLERSANI